MKRLYRLLILLPLTFIIIAMASCGSGDDVYDLVNGYEDIFVSDNISAGTKTVTVNIADNKKLRIKNGESNLIIDLKVVAKYGNKSRTIYDSSKHNYYIASNSKIDTGYILRKNKDFKISFIVGNRLKLDKQDEGIFKISNSEKK